MTNIQEKQAPIEEAKVPKVERIFKYSIPSVSSNQFFQVLMPKHAAILSTQVQADQICMWAAIVEGDPIVSREFIAVRTGSVVPTPPAEEGKVLRYFATVQFVTVQGMLSVWHLMECEKCQFDPRFQLITELAEAFTGGGGSDEADNQEARE